MELIQKNYFAHVYNDFGGLEFSMLKKGNLQIYNEGLISGHDREPKLKQKVVGIIQDLFIVHNGRNYSHFYQQGLVETSMHFTTEFGVFQVDCFLENFGVWGYAPKEKEGIILTFEKNGFEVQVTDFVILVYHKYWVING